MTSMPRDTAGRILRSATEIIQTGGPAALTFDAIAARVGITKQAVLYWYPNKSALLSAIALPGLRAEAEAAMTAANAASGPADARQRIVLALIAFHLADLPRFRLMYLSQQGAGAARLGRDVLERIHPVTDTMYSAIARALGGTDAARAQAVALHMAALGHLLLVALAEAVQDPLKQDPEALARTLAEMLAQPAGE
ncbi:MAG: transcriptional regulator, TetR family [Rhodobacteraceae bacterium HLUCCA12]|nr:MAG: transcriptional regulator, TetR family [Rhodobacteraceae bacterium HLUCCA12]